MKRWTLKVILALMSVSTTWLPSPSIASNSCEALFSDATTEGLIWGKSFNFELAESTLRSQKSFRKIVPMSEYLKSIGKEPSGTSEVYYVEFHNGLRGVWKPDLYLTGPMAEEAAYLVARKLGMDTFVPTVVTEIEGRKGSLSVFIETPVDLVAMDGKARAVAIAKIPQKQWVDMEAVHFLLGQWDRHAGNLLVDKDFNLIVIDNEGISKLSLWRVSKSPVVQLANVPKEERTGIDLKKGNSPDFARVEYIDGNDMAGFEAFVKKFSIKPATITLKHFERYPDRRIPYIVWRDILWRERTSKSLPLIDLKVLSISTVEALTKLGEKELREILNPKVFNDLHIELILQRRSEILKQAQSAVLIP
jgi:hypothetical protein